MGLLKQGVIPAIKPGKAWVISRAQFLMAMDDWCVASAGEANKKHQKELLEEERRRRASDARAFRTLPKN